MSMLFVFLGNAGKASEILTELDKGVPGIIMVKLRRINLERRRGNTDAVSGLYEEAMIETSDQELATFFAIRYARFLAKVSCTVEPFKPQVSTHKFSKLICIHFLKE